MNVVPRSTGRGLFMGSSSTLIYTSELILCSTICVPSATRHNIHMYPCLGQLASTGIILTGHPILSGHQLQIVPYFSSYVFFERNL